MCCLLPAKTPATDVDDRVPTQFRYKEFKGKVCAGSAYTDDKARGCNGWAGISEVECQQHCSQNAVAPNCPAKKCMAASFFSAGGWCHLYEPSECKKQNANILSLTYKKVEHKKVEQGLWNNPLVHDAQKAIHSTAAREAVSAGAAAIAFGAAAAGVAAAVETRDQQSATVSESATVSAKSGQGRPLAQLRQSQHAERTDAAVATTHVAGSAGDRSPLPQQKAASSATAAPTQPPAAAMPSVTGAEELVTSGTTTTSVANFLGASGSSKSGLPLWLPLVVLSCCCCLAVAAVAGLACSRRKSSRSRSVDDSYSDEDDYDGEDFDDEYGSD